MVRWDSAPTPARPESNASSAARITRSVTETGTSTDTGAFGTNPSCNSWARSCFGQEEWFRRTIFVFVADHVSSEKFADQTRSYPENMHILAFIHTPDGALQGEVTEIAQQLDLMPTLLGLIGNREPYFAFGRDVLNEPLYPRWSVSYDGQFRALTDRGPLLLNDAGAPVSPTIPDADTLTMRFQALLQQYYGHIENKNYTVHD